VWQKRRRWLRHGGDEGGCDKGSAVSRKEKERTSHAPALSRHCSWDNRVPKIILQHRSHQNFMSPSLDSLHVESLKFSSKKLSADHLSRTIQNSKRRQPGSTILSEFTHIRWIGLGQNLQLNSTNFADNSGVKFGFNQLQILNICQICKPCSQLETGFQTLMTTIRATNLSSRSPTLMHFVMSVRAFVHI
jgi:AraC-like DNA-binding protein